MRRFLFSGLPLLAPLAALEIACVHSAPIEPIGTSVRAPTVTTATEFDDADPEALTLFRPELSPYGAWVDDAVAGTVWIPRTEEVGEGFVPYASHGHFAYRESAGAPEYVWVSDVSWGWVTFHYGRWTYLAKRGAWAWVPGRRYAGAWVTFRVSRDGCSPASPARACVVGWGPRAPHLAWHGEEPVRRPARTALFVYARAKDLFEDDLSARLLRGDALGEAAGRSVLADAPSLGELGITPSTALAPPVYDTELRKAYLYATPDSAHAMGLAPGVGRRPLRTFVAGGPRYVAADDR